MRGAKETLFFLQEEIYGEEEEEESQSVSRSMESMDEWNSNSGGACKAAAPIRLQEN
jgi:hypothetical protein